MSGVATRIRESCIILRIYIYRLVVNIVYIFNLVK